MPVYNTYFYEPLKARDEIRLLVLNPAKNKTTPLSCSIISHRLPSQTQKYSAVSYSWGEAKPTHSLEITHDNDTSYLKITATVDILLRHLRAPREVRYLWIDAICLNQGDETEKARQIPIMGYIYKEAMDVQIWLGAGDEMTSTLCCSLREICRSPERKQRMMAGRIVALMKKFFHDDTQPTSAKDMARPGCAVGFKCWYQFFQNPWFSRRWIIQEAVLARKGIVKMGEYEIPWGTVTLAAKRLQSFDMSDYPMKAAASMNERTKDSSILESLWTFHEACCSEEKDRVAALIGLSSGDGFKLNYRMSWEDIYKQVASSAFCSESNETRIQVLLHLFEFGAVANDGGLNYPSWVPDWSKKRIRELPYHSDSRNVDTHEKYPAFLDVSDKATLTLDDNILHIQPPVSEHGQRAWQVVHLMSSGKSHMESVHVIDLLERFFPLSSAESPWMLLEFSSFIQYVGEFCHLREKDQSPAFQMYSEQVLRHFSESITSKHFEALRWLGTLLHDFCLCELRPYGLTTSSCRGFIIGPNRILPNDIVVPIWRRTEDGAKNRFIVNYGARITVGITTMLTIRYGEGIHVPSECRLMEDDFKVRGRIIGPAIGIELQTALDAEETSLPQSEQRDYKGGFFVF